MAGTAERGPTVLIVDDDPDAAWLLASALERRGFQARTAFDLAGATALLREERFDALLADLVLPVGDGYARLAIGRRPRVVIALSGMAGASEESRAQQAGFDAFVVKPPSIDALVDVIRRGL